MAFLLLIILGSGSVAAGAETRATLESGAELIVEATPHSRYLPHVFYDQGKASLSVLFPQHELLAERRFGRLGEISYSLLAYKEQKEASTVIVQGMAERYPLAWRFEARCDEDRFQATLLQVLEELSRLPSDSVAGGEPAAAPPP